LSPYFACLSHFLTFLSQFGPSKNWERFRDENLLACWSQSSCWFPYLLLDWNSLCHNPKLRSHIHHIFEHSATYFINKTKFYLCPRRQTLLFKILLFFCCSFDFINKTVWNSTLERIRRRKQRCWKSGFDWTVDGVGLRGAGSLLYSYTNMSRPRHVPFTSSLLQIAILLLGSYFLDLPIPTRRAPAINLIL